MAVAEQVFMRTVPLRQTYAAAVSLECFKGILFRERENIAVDRAAANLQFSRKLWYGIPPPTKQNAHDFGTAFVCAHGLHPLSSGLRPL
jgi:hypothetical protein